MDFEIFAAIKNWPTAKVNPLKKQTGFIAVLLLSLASCLAQTPGPNPNPVKVCLQGMSASCPDNISRTINYDSRNNLIKPESV